MMLFGRGGGNDLTMGLEEIVMGAFVGSIAGAALGFGSGYAVKEFTTDATKAAIRADYQKQIDAVRAAVAEAG
jgi:hypothetical protein